MKKILASIFSDRTKEKINKIKSKLLGFNFTDGLLSKIVVYLLLIGISYVFIYPLLRMASFSFMTVSDLIDPEVDWIPSGFTFQTIITALRVLDMPRSMFNSIWVSALFATLQTIVSALTGFAFARYDFKFKKFWFAMVLLSFIIPIPVVLIPRTMMFITLQDANINLFGTLVPQILLSITGQGIYSAILILIFYNFFRMIPSVLDEAARIDGANAIQVFYHIILKLSLPTIFTVFLLSFVWNWNETYITQTFLGTSKLLLPSALNRFDELFGVVRSADSGIGRINEAYRLAGTFISIIPLLVLYLFVQRLFVEGIEKTGITGE